MKDCHSQAVRASRASSLSEKRRSSPRRGDSTSPTLEPLPGKRVPCKRVYTAENSNQQHHQPSKMEITRLNEELRVERARGRIEGGALPERQKAYSMERTLKQFTGMEASTWSWAATLCDASRSTISLGEKPASPMRAKMVSVESDGSGTSRSGDGCEMFERPARNWRRGPPAQLETPTAPANWMLSDKML